MPLQKKSAKSTKQLDEKRATQKNYQKKLLTT